MLSYDDSSSWLIIIFVLWFLIYRNIGCCDFLFFSHSMEYNAKNEISKPEIRLICLITCFLALKIRTETFYQIEIIS